MILILLTLPSLLFACGSKESSIGAAPETCAGCPAEAEVDQAIVDFAVSKLASGDGKCSRADVQVENFQSQVVAGMLYKFDLVLNHKSEAGDTCSKENGVQEKCHVEVYDVPWLEQREVSWDKTTCTRD